MNAYAKLVDHLHAKGLARGRYFQCPSHEDRLPSLSVKEGEAGVLVYCHAGCTVHEVVAALGLEVADLFDDSDWQPDPDYTPTSRYPYIPPPEFIEVEGQRVWCDWRTRAQARADAALHNMDDERFSHPGVELVGDEEYKPTPRELAVEGRFPEVGWVLTRPPEERFYLHGEYLEATKRKFGEVPSWVWTALGAS